MTVEALDSFLTNHGFVYTVSNRTVLYDEEGYKQPRGQQILHYIENHPCDKYIVLDDDTFDMEKVAHRQVVTKFKSGFSESKLEEAINLILLEN
jgi:hypothetical protein